jgi:predicted dehydrogenase
MTQLKIAIIGAGILGSRHARVFHEQPESETAAVVDVNRERAEKIAALYKAKAYTDFNTMLQNENVDAVAVATPDHLHRDPVIAAIQAGKHVFMEKPIATQIEEAREIASAAASSNVTVMVNYSQRYLTDYAWIKQRIVAGEIGKPVMAISIKYDTIYVPTGMIPSWSSATSPIYFMSSHDLDLVHWYLGVDPVEVLAHETRGVLEGKGIRAHDGVNALIQFDGGISTNFHSSWIHPTTYPSVADGYMQIIGSEGAISYNNCTRRADIYNTKGGYDLTFAGPQTATEVEGKIVGAFTDSVRHFLNCIIEKREPDTSPRQVLPTSEAQAAIMESIKTHRAIKIKLC